MSKQSEFRKIYPDIHSGTCDYFPDFDYRNCVGDRSVICDMRNPKNMVGHQQRAFTVWWALEKCGPTDPGLDLGSPKGLTPFCIHVDVFGDGGVHPFYGGGAYQADIAFDATRIWSIVPWNSLPHIASNHSLEHMPADGDTGIQLMLCKWIALLRPGGVLAMLIPDNDDFDVMASDKDHKHAWGHSDFRRRVLDRVLAEGTSKLIEYNTMDNHFSFNVVLERI
jgi:hypothetical protein